MLLVIALIVIIYPVGVGVALSPTVRENGIPRRPPDFTAAAHSSSRLRSGGTGVP